MRVLVGVGVRTIRVGVSLGTGVSVAGGRFVAVLVGGRGVDVKVGTVVDVGGSAVNVRVGVALG
jgi:hypothetical protein